MFDGFKKAIAPKPKVGENILDQMVYSWLNTNMVVWYNAQQSNIYVEKGYQGNAIVYAIIRAIGDKKKVAPPLVYKQNDRQKVVKYKAYKYAGTPQSHAQSLTMRTKAMTFDDNNDLAKLLKNPNPYQNWSEFSDACAGFYDSCGEAFIYGVGPGDDSINAGKYSELYVMPSHLVTIVTGTVGEPILGYKMRIGDQGKMIPAKDVCHMKQWNPRWDLNGSQLRGQSPLLAGLKYLTKNDIGVFSATKLLQNQGAETIVSPNHADPKLWLTPDQVNKTEDAIMAKVNGAQNKGKTVVSGMPLQATQLGLSPQALQIIEGLDHDAKTLCGLWPGFNPILLGIGDLTFTNKTQAQKELVTDNVIPYLNNLEQKLMQWLVPAFNKADNCQYIIDFDTTVYPELQEDLKLLKEVYGSPSLEEDERRGLFNFDELGGERGKAILVPSGQITLEEAITPMEPEVPIKDMFGDYSDVKKKFDPNQPRDDHGRWTDEAQYGTIINQVSEETHVKFTKSRNTNSWYGTTHDDTDIRISDHPSKFVERRRELLGRDAMDLNIDYYSKKGMVHLINKTDPFSNYKKGDKIIHASTTIGEATYLDSDFKAGWVQVEKNNGDVVKYDMHKFLSNANDLK